MNVRTTSVARLGGAVLFVVVVVAGSMAVAKNNEYIHDPWVAPGEMQVERSVGMAQQEQLQVRLLTGQSGR